MELVSIIIPVYKVERYLDGCVQSIVNQTYKNIEIILIDDGSPDSCPVLCDKWAALDRRIRVIHKSNGGLSDARNCGLAAAHGAYISFIDSDDWVQKDFIQVMYETMLQDQSDVVECGVQFVKEDHTVLRTRSCEHDHITTDRVEALRRLVLEKGVYQTVWNKLYRSEVIKDTLFEVGKYHEDDFWTYQVLKRIHRMTILAKPMYCYLQRQQSIMGSSYSLKRLDGLEARVYRMRQLANEPALKNLVENRIWYDYLYHYQCALRCLTGEEQKTVLDQINVYMQMTPKAFRSPYGYNLKQLIWIRAFKVSPTAVALLRNRLNIGI